MSEEKIIKLRDLDNSILKKRNKIIENYNNYDDFLFNDLTNYIELLVESIVSNNSPFANFRNNEIIQLIKIAMKKYEENPPKRVGKHTIVDIKQYFDIKYPNLFNNEVKNQLDECYKRINDSTSVNILNELATSSYSYSEIIPINAAKKIIKCYSKDTFGELSLEALKAAIISIGQHELRKNGINNITIFFGEGYNYQTGQASRGTYSGLSKVITLDESKILEYYQAKKTIILIYEMFNVMFHEIEHAIQEKIMSNNNEISFKKILFIKEQIIMKEYPNFYEENYKYIFREIYARIAGEISARDYMTSIFNINFRKDGSFKETIISEMQKLDASMIKHVNSKTEDLPLLDLFDYHISNLSEDNLKKYFERFPILNLEYNPDGSRKKATEIFLQIDKRLLEVNSNDNCDKIRIKAKLYSYTQLYIENSLSYIIMDEDNISKMNLQDSLLKKIINSSIEKLYKKEIDNHDEEVRTTHGK